MTRKWLEQCWNEKLWKRDLAGGLEKEVDKVEDRMLTKTPRRRRKNLLFNTSLVEQESFINIKLTNLIKNGWQNYSHFCNNNYNNYY